MPENLDLNLLPLIRKGGREETDTPGLHIALPPRRCQRSRSEDRLALYFSMTGSAAISAAHQEQLLVKLAGSFYDTPGSVTLALRKIAEQVNQFILDRNLQASSTGKQGIGILALAVLRGSRLTLGQSGPGHAFLLSQNEVEHYFDPQGSGRGLGLARSLSIRFYQMELRPNDVLILSPQPPPGWTPANLKGIPSQGLDPLRRRLISQSGLELNAVVIQAQPGTGKLRLLRTRPISQMAQPTEAGQPAESAPPVDRTSSSTLPGAEPEFPPQVPEPASETGSFAEEPALDPDYEPFASEFEDDQELSSYEPESEHPVEPRLVPSRGSSSGEPAPSPAHSPASPQSASPASSRISRPPVAPEKPAPKPKRAPRQPVNLPVAPVLGALGVIGRAFRSTFQAIARALLVALKTILPDESLFTISPSSMAFIAIGVAVIMATMGGTVYIQRGRSNQYQAYFTQADQAAQFARQQTDPLELRTAWETTLHFLNQADAFRKDQPESVGLRAEAQGVLDSLDGIRRLDFQPAVTGGFPAEVYITHMEASDSDLYMLNATSGSVIRAIRTGSGYEIDPNFVCSPTPSVSRLVDFALLPKGSSNLNASLVAVDTYGNLLYCIPGAQSAEAPPAPPHTNWGKVVGLTVDSGDLYVLDPDTNGVWFYRGMDTSQPPHLFFGDQVPYMKDVIDLEVNNDDLYLLHADGKVTLCAFSSLQGSPTRCVDPLEYSDSRPGRQPGPTILDSSFSQLFYSPPPEPSMYMLDPVNQSIYFFSLRLNFHAQYRPFAKLPGDSATAFAIGPSRMAFLATGSHVYYALLP